MVDVKHFIDQRLNHLFKIGDYVHVELRSADSVGYSSTCVLMIHGIFCSKSDELETDYSLLVSRYSFLSTSPLYQKSSTTLEDKAAENELVLHFRDFETMGQKQDAESISASDFGSAFELDIDPEGEADPVVHVVKAPEGQSILIMILLPA